MLDLKNNTFIYDKKHCENITLNINSLLCYNMSNLQFVEKIFKI